MRKTLKQKLNDIKSDSSLTEEQKESRYKISGILDHLHQINVKARNRDKERMDNLKKNNPEKYKKLLPFYQKLINSYKD